MVGHDRAFVRRDKVAMSDADQGEMKTPAARAAMSASLQASLGLATSPYEREAQLTLKASILLDTGFLPHSEF